MVVWMSYGHVKSLSAGGPGIVQSVEALSFGGAIVSGGYSNTQCFAKRLDPAGEVVWTTTFTCGGQTAVPGALVDGESSFWQVSANLPVVNQVGEVRKLDIASGQILWKHLVTGTVDCHAIAAHPAGGAVIGCEGAVMWTDGIADEVSKSTSKWWNTTVGVDFARAVHVLPNGQVTVGGRASNVGYVQRLDATGAQVWMTLVDKTSCNQVDSVNVLADGSIIAFGQVGPAGEGWFFKLSGSGQLLTSKNFFNCGNYGCFHDLVELSSGQLAVVGSLDGQAALHWMTNDGTILATKKWPLGNNAIFWDIEPVGGSGFLLGGQYIQSLLHVDSFGNDSCAAAGLCAFKSIGDCDDKNACTWDTCNSAKGCMYSNVTDGSTCATGKTCQAGTCK
jgi:hypothetical protein